MDKQIKQSILILGVLVVLSVAFAIVFYLQKQAAENQVVSLSGRVTDFENKDRESQKKLKALQEDANKLRQELDQRTNERAAAVQKAESIQRDADRLSKDLEKVQKERSDWDEKLSNIRKERDKLLDQITELKNRPVPEKIVEKIVYRDKPAEAPAAAPASGAPAAPAAGSQGVTPAQAMNDVFAAAAVSSMPANAGKENEDYWAGVIRSKAALELELQKVKADLNATNLTIAELKKSNSDFEGEIGRLKNEKDAIMRKIKYGEDLADNISVELARSRNEQKIAQDRADQMLMENQQLRLDIKQLNTTKVALEKSIANLSDEKRSIEKKLVETENIIQSRVDEIWQIKKDIDKRFNSQRAASGEIELAPIVVNAKKGKEAKAPAKAAARGLQGGIVSVNEENNFVIVDLGEKSGVQVGDAFKVFHNGVQVGAVEVIQVRQDICAADIKQKSVPFSVGDTVR